MRTEDQQIAGESISTHPISSSTSPKSFDLKMAIERVREWLPTQGPLKDFIHHNTLHAFQNRPFHEALAVASDLYGARDYLSVDEYRELFRHGRISTESITRSLTRFGIPESDHSNWRNRLLNESCGKRVPPGRVRSGIRGLWLKERGVDLDALTHPMLFKLLSGFLDQGISIWRMPHATDTFWGAVSRLIGESSLPVAPLSDPICRSLLLKSPEEATLECLNRIVGDSAFFEAYLLEMLFSHPGWSGMVHMIETDPGSLLTTRKISILELVALELVFEVGWLTRKLGKDFQPIAHAEWEVPPPPEQMVPESSPLRELKRVWHEAMEWTLYEEFLGQFGHHPKTEKAAEAPSVQVFFCLDDRSCSLRRHLEETEPTISTYGTAGFFGIDVLFQQEGSDRAVKYCPVAVSPQHVVREYTTHPPTYQRPRRLSQIFRSNPESNTLFRGWLLTQTIGIWASVRLAFKVFLPGSRLIADERLTRIDHPTRLHLFRESEEEVSEEGYLIGYSIAEMVDRVFGVLVSVGLGEKFSKLIVVVGHGATSANNPHFAAYDCGACSGKPGSPNARAFALMANDPKVREGLSAKGLRIPSDCHFLGAVHDTTRDEFGYFDLELLPQSHREDFKKLDGALQEALGRNAKERCERFELAPTGLSEKAALRHVRDRARSIFEPRPELNHAGNAFCVIGRRDLTRGLFLNRRAFLNSYDPTQDRSGDVLASILSAVVPVCGGINLEYLFSRVDNHIYGAGTKLPHNVVSLLGVANGVEGDLRTGLPSQMVEVHEPVRLLILAEQEPEAAMRAIGKHPPIFEWIEKEWVVFACWSPSEDKPYLFDKGTMIPLTLSRNTFSPVERNSR